jgi:adenylate cyclase
MFPEGITKKASTGYLYPIGGFCIWGGAPMTNESFKRKLTAILSADVEGYSRLMGEDEDATIRTLTSYRELMTTLIQKHRGRVVDSPGDNLLAEFLSVVDAVRCAVEIQEELRVRNAELPENRRMEFRIGINLGDVVQEEERIYGDGINIAARVEGLAEGGGICISGTVYDSIKNKLSLSYESMGEHTVKNIKEPVRVYRMRVGPETEAPVVREEKAGLRRWQKAALVAVVILVVAVGAFAIWNFYLRPPPIEPASVEKMAFPLPEKPSIAVLPFTNMSGDKEQEYFSDGITEEIITALSKTPKLFVIASNSVFTYKDKPVKVQQVAEELGVRYVLEGSVRKAGERVRITAQLIDAITGHHLWSERYDRKIEDTFVIQDEIALKIILALQVELTEGEHAYMLVRGTNNLEAYLKALKAVHHFRRFTADDNARCQQLAQEIVALDPKYPTGLVMLAWADLQAVQFGWSKSPKKSMEQAAELARKVEALGEAQGAHYLFGYIYLLSKQHEKAINELKTALDFVGSNSADINAVLGYALNLSGRPEEGIEYLKKGMRLNPIYPSWYLSALGSGYRLSGKYQEAIRAYESLLRRKDAPPLGVHQSLAITYVLLGKNEQAQAHVNEILKLDPKYCLKSYAKRSLYKDRALLERDLEALRKAGLPDKPPLPLPDKPSIAVLPFTNMSDDPKQEYFSDGITEQIITGLSKVPKLFVIARTSSFKYKGRKVDVRKVGRELGVRYVLEGSVQKSGNRLRITAQLIDAIEGHHLWSERYDRELKDIFALQDDITMKIMTAMQVKLTLGEQQRTLGKGTDNFKAYIKYIHAYEVLYKFNKQDNILSRMLAKEAIALDPGFGLAYSVLGWTYLIETMFGWSKSPEQSLSQAMDLAKKALALNDSLDCAHGLLGYCYRLKGEYEKAVAESNRALEVAPNAERAHQYLGMALIFAGRSEEAIPVYERAMRLSPFPTSVTLNYSGLAHLLTGRYEEAISMCKKAVDVSPSYIFPHIYLTVAYDAAGRDEEARAEAEEVLRLNPKFSVDFVKTLKYKRKADTDLLVNGLRKAGLK